MDEMDLHSLKEFKIYNVPHQTNAIVESIKRGLIDVLSFALNEGYVNSRSALRTKDPYELLSNENECYPLNLLDCQSMDSFY